MASGSQMNRGTCADLPAAPMRKQMPTAVATSSGRYSMPSLARSASMLRSRVPAWV